MYHVDVIRIPWRSPGDTTGLAGLIDSGRVAATDIVAVMGKTEGNGCVNDYTREYATAMLAGCLGRYLGLEPAEVERRVAFVMSGGTEGVLSPHLTVFARKPAAAGAPAGQKRMTIGIAFTRDFLPEEIGRRAQVEETALAVRRAMQDGGIAATDDVHFVQVKCPLLTPTKIAQARARGCEPVTADTYESMGYSRGASALGVALATGEAAAAAADRRGRAARLEPVVLGRVHLRRHRAGAERGDRDGHERAGQQRAGDRPRRDARRDRRRRGAPHDGRAGHPRRR